MKINTFHQVDINRLLYTASIFSMLAGIIHLIVMPEHFVEWAAYGVFFLVAAACQLIFGFLLFFQRPVSRELLWAGIIGNLAIIFLWLYTRTVGVPFGPMAGETEPFGSLDTISKISEMVTIICSIVVFREYSKN
jgi:hypothetical protein